MSIEAQKILALLAFALVCMVLNIKSAWNFLNYLTMAGIVASLGIAGYLVFGWVIA